MEGLNNHAYFNNWTPKEDSIIEEFIIKNSSKTKAFCYTQIALQLEDKCILDVVMRCRWLNEKYKKQGRNHILCEFMDKKENFRETFPKLTPVASNTNGPPNTQAIKPTDSDGEISYQAVGGPSGKLLKGNGQALDQIYANFAASKIEETINLLSKAQNNLHSILNSLNDASAMKLNEEPVNSILHQDKP